MRGLDANDDMREQETIRTMVVWKTSLWLTSTTVPAEAWALMKSFCLFNL